MSQPEPLAHEDVEVQIEKVTNALDVLSLVFDTGDQDRTLDCGQCDGMRLLFDALKDRLSDAASVMAADLRLAKEAAGHQNAAYNKAWRLGTEFGAMCAKMGEDHRQGPPPSWRDYFQGWTGDEAPVADQPVYPSVHPAAPEEEEPDTLSA